MSLAEPLPLENRELLRAFNSIFLANENQEDGSGNNYD